MNGNEMKIIIIKLMFDIKKPQNESLTYRNVPFSHEDEVFSFTKFLSNVTMFHISYEFSCVTCEVLLKVSESTCHSFADSL